MKKHLHADAFLHKLTRCFLGGCLLVFLACGCHAQKQLPANQSRDATWIDWTIEYKGELSQDEKAKLYSAIDSYVKDQLVAQKKWDKGKDLHLKYTESGNSIRASLDGSEVSIGSIVGGPLPPPPPIIPNDKLKAINAKVTGVRSVKLNAGAPNRVGH